MTAVRALLAATLSYACMAAAAAQAGQGLASGDTLVAGVQYVPPPFVAGAKVRTPEGVATALVDDLAKRLSLQAQTVAADPARPGAMLEAGKANLLLVPAVESKASAATTVSISTGHSSGAMAIMRTDTDIKTWDQLQGRTVCMSEGGRYVGQMAARYGAVEKLFRAPADSLLALRIGGCDAAVHDSAMLNELIKLPEWKKFSARLPVRDVAPLVFLIPSGDVQSRDALKKVSGDWADSRYLEKLVKLAARDIAFEVYLDQTVTDCH